jgi:hypothetical protein
VKFGAFDIGHIKGQLRTWFRNTCMTHILAWASSRMQSSNYCSHRPYQHSRLLVGPDIYGRFRLRVGRRATPFFTKWQRYIARTEEAISWVAGPNSPCVISPLEPRRSLHHTCLSTLAWKDVVVCDVAAQPAGRIR